MGRPVPALTLRREDGRVVAESVTVADSTARRLRGLLGTKDLPAGNGVLLRPAWSIHTAFMRFPIDVVFLDQDQVVIKIVPELKPFSMASCRGAREVVELRAGEVGRRSLQIGDRVAWAARSTWDDGASSESVLLSGRSAGGDTAVQASVLLASSDERFAKLLKFLLDGNDLSVVATVPLADVVDGMRQHGPDVVVADVDRRLADGLRKVNVMRASRPELELVVVAAEPPRHPPGGMVVYDKWNETDEIVAACARAVDHRVGIHEATPMERETWS